MFFFFQAEDGIRDYKVTGVQTCALPIFKSEFGALDIFVNNARPEVATFYEGPMTIGLDMFDFAINSQAKAFLVGVQEAVPMLRDGGRIIAMTYAPGGRTGSWQPWVAKIGRASCRERV